MSDTGGLPNTGPPESSLLRCGPAVKKKKSIRYLDQTCFFPLVVPVRAKQGSSRADAKDSGNVTWYEFLSNE